LIAKYVIRLFHIYFSYIRAYGRIGNAYAQQEDYANAIKFYEKSLTEHRTPDVLKRLREVEKLNDDKQRAAYQNPELAEEARNKGNEFFKDGKFAEAIPFYTEAIQRAESDPRGYSNRAACYTKLMALPEALRDAEKSIALDKTFG
jgi:stress-induced-phosphoprotein 1